MRELLRNPTYAAVAAAAATMFFIYVTHHIKGLENQKNSTYFKPAVLNGLLVYLIVYFGQLE